MWTQVCGKCSIEQNTEKKIRKYPLCGGKMLPGNSWKLKP